ncbi:uncharacterized protein LOC135371786 [Ornithodoros turicata]|uniref:uncharacterized protein LOC135371786 n=1 Tax=Ornithodoros turicata TaxID=34597 RepID=UPI00313A03CB
MARGRTYSRHHRQHCRRCLRIDVGVPFRGPFTMTTDRGRQIESSIFATLTALLGTHRTRTTAYHPASNGLVERFHRHLKAALRAHSNSSAWTEALPVILLGLLSVFKSDLGCTTAQLVYGTTLRLPGEFFAPASASTVPDPTDYVSRLRAVFADLRPTSPRRTSGARVYVHRDLLTCTHVFVRVDAVRKPLQPPYNGPYPVISSTPKHFMLRINGKDDQVSIDRLKPAYTEACSQLGYTICQPQAPASPCPTP